MTLNGNRLYKDVGLPLAANRYLPTTARLQPRSLFHSSYYRVALQPKVANIVTVHDFTYEFFRSGLPRLVHRLQKWVALTCADGIICNSENTRADMLRFYPSLKGKRQTVIHLGANGAFRPLTKTTDPASTSQPSENPSLLLFIGDRRYDYKNFKLAVLAVGLLKDYHLAIVGGHPLSSDEQRMIDQHLGQRYEIHPAPSVTALNELYNRAFCLLYPSLYEGFGLPVLEALCCGCPVVTTNRSSIPEVVGKAGVVLDEVTPASLAEAVKRLEDPSVRGKYIISGFKRARRFSWQRCAGETLKFYRRVYDDLFLR
jgi:mannosyltransferase